MNLYKNHIFEFFIYDFYLKKKKKKKEKKGKRKIQHALCYVKPISGKLTLKTENTRKAISS